MSDTNEPASGAESTTYNDVNMSCGHCSSWLTPSYQQAFELIQLQPISCDHCGSDLLLEEGDRQVLDKKLKTAARVGKLATLIMLPYFLIGLVVSLNSPFPGFSGLLVGVGIVLAFIIKSVATVNIDRDFVLFKHGERPEPAQAD
ncbi:hypothetical protein ACX3YC_01295 [Pseudomonas mohnii]|jgi:hypothetical protein|uniref:hypothetical protein n=1 Tax=Pseudomonas sp. MIL9 TaxID=2807620 RepID=UPI00102A913A|nr:hypothetical protein [Pseudomonas sp. MIL9]MBM6444016.1 hypothetical protein [Pseudomonas sp. MIL9]RZO09728.1 hypothetical protein EKG40_07785 [Pseudomonas moorei]